MSPNLSSLLPTHKETEALLGNRPPKSTHKPFLKRSVFLLIIFALVFSIIHGSASYFGSPAKPKKKNIVFFVTDGMGPASLSLTRSFRQFRDDLPHNDTLFLDKHLIGSSRTRSSDSLVTDSAAGATVFACSAKTYNGAIGVFPDKRPCGTILEALKLEGYLTGLVVTTRITDATPASFSAHVDYRFQEDLIAEHQLGYYPLGRMVDLILGGGRCHFHGCRSDDRNLITEAVNDGWTYVGNRSSFDQLQLGKNPGIELPLLGLLADTDIPFDLDRDSEVYPSLEEQAITALNILHEKTKDSDKGFFLLIEGSRIDHGGHFNDPVAQVNEVLAFDKAFKAVKQFVDGIADEADTVMLSTSDHETGGLSVAKQIQETYPDYLWIPEVLNNATHTSEYLTNKIKLYVKENSSVDADKLKQFLAAQVETHLGITNLQDTELESLVANKHAPQDSIVQMINIRAQIGWATHGHSAVDVNVYAHGSSESIYTNILRNLLGNHENIEIGQFLSGIEKEVDLDRVTELIKDTEHSPSSKELAQFLKEETMDSVDNIPHEQLRAMVKQKLAEIYVQR